MQELSALSRDGDLPDEEDVVPITFASGEKVIGEVVDVEEGFEPDDIPQTGIYTRIRVSIDEVRGVVMAPADAVDGIEGWDIFVPVSVEPESGNDPGSGESEPAPVARAFYYSDESGSYEQMTPTHVSDIGPAQSETEEIPGHRNRSDETPVEQSPADVTPAGESDHE